MNYAGVCTSVKIFVLCVCACVIEREKEREREREREREKGCERVHVCVKMRHLNASTNMYSYIVHNSALLLHTTYQAPTPCCYLGEYQATRNLM